MRLLLCLSATLLGASEATVRWHETRQRIDGFGACDAWFGGRFIDSPKGGEMLDLLYKRQGGIGLSILRQRISPEVCTAAGTYDWQNKNVVQNLWMAQQAVARGCELIWWSSWTPPGWMKDTGTEKGGGHLKPEHDADYADFLVAYHGHLAPQYPLPIHGISPQNEPGKKKWEACEWTGDRFRDFLKVLRPKLDPAVRIIAPEGTGWGEIHKFLAPTKADPVADAAVGIIAFHCYFGQPKDDSTLRLFQRPVWQTEWSHDTKKNDPSIADGLVWAVNCWKMLVVAQTSTHHFWWLANFHADGKGQALLNPVDKEGTAFATTKRLWTLGNFSRHVRPGWVRLDADGQPAVGVHLAAFKNPADGACAVVVINTGEAVDLAIRLDGAAVPTWTPEVTSADLDLAEQPAVAGGASFVAKLPAQAVVTYRGQAR
jgi:glucuronoarabinoxylan endo-1,4-beta-xylanase